MIKDIRNRLSSLYSLDLKRPPSSQSDMPPTPCPDSPVPVLPSFMASLTSQPPSLRTASTPSTPSTASSPSRSSVTYLHSPSAASLMSLGSEQLLDHSHLKPGDNAALLSYTKTINMYRENVTKTNDPDIQCDFAIFLVEAAERLQQKEERHNDEDPASRSRCNSTSASSSEASHDNELSSDSQDVPGLQDAQPDTSANNDIGKSSSSTCSSTSSTHSTVSSSSTESSQQQRKKLCTREDELDHGEAAPRSYLLEAEKLLKQVAQRGHCESQYYLANMYAAGLLNKQGQPDYEKAFPMFVHAAKHHQPDAAYRTAQCYEDRLGTRCDKGKAAQFYRKAAVLNHPGAMHRLGVAFLHGELGITKNVREAHKWLKRSAEAATPLYPHALHTLALLHEKGAEAIVFPDQAYAIRLLEHASQLGYAPSAYRLGEIYEFGKLGCEANPQLSVQYYSLAALQNHSEACIALTSWYLIGIDGYLECNEEQAFAWAMQAAQSNYPKAEYAIAYFYERGIGTNEDMEQAMVWYKRAAQHGHKGAVRYIKEAGIAMTPTSSPGARFFKRAKSLLRKQA